jgi:L-ascorbate metabolism protein UlaG (beta-lactamase superfamily)
MLQGITWYHHATVLLRRENLAVYIDPWQIPAESPAADIILITHEHYDHYSPPDIRQLSKENTQVVVPRSMLGQTAANAHAMKPGETVKLGQVTITAVPAYNLRKTFHPLHQCWLGYVVEIAGVRYYHAGDTDLTPEMREVRANVVFLPVSGTYTMDAAQAAQAALAIRPNLAIPIHWGKVVGDERDARQFVEKVGATAQILEKARSY